MTTVYEHRIYCQTLDCWATIWKEDQTPLAACPHQRADGEAAHTVTADSWCIMRTVAPNSVSITKESANAQQTNGYIRVEAVVFDIAANSSTTITKAWPYNIAIYTVRFSVSEACVGVQYKADVKPRTLVGYLTGAPTVGPGESPTTTLLPASSTALTNAKPGFICTLQNGATFLELGEVCAIDAGTGKIEVNCLLSALDGFPLSGVTYVEVGARPFPLMEFNRSGEYRVGDDRFNSMFLQRNYPIVSVVTNPNPAPARLIVYVHYAH